MAIKLSLRKKLTEPIQEFMKAKSTLLRNLSLFVAPLVSSSILVTLPSQAASLARADAYVDLLNFSHNPESATADVRAKSSTVITKTENETVFLIEQAFGFTNSSIEAFSGRQHHLGLTQVDSKLIGNFFIDANPDSPQSFSFNFDAFAKLQTSIDDLTQRTASAKADVALLLLGKSDKDNYEILDYFSLNRSIQSTGRDRLPVYKKSGHFKVDLFKSSANVGLELRTEGSNVQVMGSYHRDFDTPTHLTLIAAKKMRVKVNVPEPSGTFVLLVFGGWLGACLVKKSKALKP